MKRFLVACAIVSTCVLLAGCGNGSGTTFSSLPLGVSQTQRGSGRATFHIIGDTGRAVRRAVPANAQSVRVTILEQGKVIADQTAVRNAQNGFSDITLTGLPTNIDLSAIINFYSTVDATGVPLATAQQPLNLKDGQPQSFNINATSQITHVTISAVPSLPSNKVAPNTTISLLVTATDTAGQIIPIPISPPQPANPLQAGGLTWTIANSNLLASVRVDNNGILTITTGNQPGTVTINASVAVAGSSFPAVPPFTFDIQGITQLLIAPLPPATTLPMQASAGDQVILVAKALGADGTVIVYDPALLDWSTSGPATLTKDPSVNISTLMFGLAPGDVTVTAALKGLNVPPATYKVVNTGIDKLEIVPTPLNSQIAVTNTLKLVAIARNKNGQTLSYPPANIAWTITNSTIASISSNSDGSATVTALKAGSTTITATLTVSSDPTVPTKMATFDLTVVPLTTGTGGGQFIFH